MSDSVWPHRRQPTRLPRPWDSPGKNTGVGCHFLLQCMKVKSEREVAQSCLTLSDPMDFSPPGSSVHGIFQARVLEWGAIAFSGLMAYFSLKTKQARIQWVTYSKHWKKKIINQELHIQQNYPSKNKVNFTDKEKLKESVTSRLALQEI